MVRLNRISDLVRFAATVTLVAAWLAACGTPPPQETVPSSSTIQTDQTEQVEPANRSERLVDHAENTANQWFGFVPDSDLPDSDLIVVNERQFEAPLVHSNTGYRIFLYQDAFGNQIRLTASPNPDKAPRLGIVSRVSETTVFAVVSDSTWLYEITAVGATAELPAREIVGLVETRDFGARADGIVTLPDSYQLVAEGDRFAGQSYRWEQTEYVNAEGMVAHVTIIDIPSDMPLLVAAGNLLTEVILDGERELAVFAGGAGEGPLVSWIEAGSLIRVKGRPTVDAVMALAHKIESRPTAPHQVVSARDQRLATAPLLSTADTSIGLLELRRSVELGKFIICAYPESEQRQCQALDLLATLTTIQIDDQRWLIGAYQAGGDVVSIEVDHRGLTPEPADGYMWIVEPIDHDAASVTIQVGTIPPLTADLPPQKGQLQNR